ncbi:MAG: hypothetical protein JWN04_5952 [Myxococcaceae bacterium]|nr:hypothetical protein [Myxococcaceae bacterium]
MFFAAAPFVLVFMAELFPISGALLQIGLALLVFFTAETLRRAAGRHRFLHVLLANKLEFEAYYRANPPRAFLYYVFCPVLLPHWLWKSASRRELLLYKGYTWPALVLLLLSLLLQYVRTFPPELTFRDFLPLASATIAVETLAVLMFLMPLVTSVVQMHLEHAPRRLCVLLLVGMVSIGLAAARVERRRDPIVSYATRTRVRLRQQADPAAARQAAIRALQRAWEVLPAGEGDLDADGKIEGQTLEAGRTALMQFYKNDEAHAFDLWLTRIGGTSSLVLFFPSHRARAPIWLAMDRQGQLQEQQAELAAPVLRAMGLTRPP